MTKTYCDRCATEVNNETVFVIHNPNNDYDLCGFCVTKIRRFVKNENGI